MSNGFLLFIKYIIAVFCVLCIYELSHRNELGQSAIFFLKLFIEDILTTILQHPTIEVCVQPILISAKDRQKGKFPWDVFKCCISLLQNSLIWLATLTQQYSANNIHVFSGR